MLRQSAQASYSPIVGDSWDSCRRRYCRCQSAFNALVGMQIAHSSQWRFIHCTYCYTVGTVV